MTDNDSTETAVGDAADIELGDDHLVIRRTFDAPRERVFRAFTDHEELSRWYAPGEMTAQVDTLDPEPDGKLSVSMVAGDEHHDAEATFLEVVENERLVHTWRWLHAPSEESRVTVEFVDDGDGTEVVLTHEQLPGPEAVEEHASGWAGILENLEAVVTGQ